MSWQSDWSRDSQENIRQRRSEQRNATEHPPNIAARLQERRVFCVRCNVEFRDRQNFGNIYCCGSCRKGRNSHSASWLKRRIQPTQVQQAPVHAAVQIASPVPAATPIRIPGQSVTSSIQLRRSRSRSRQQQRNIDCTVCAEKPRDATFTPCGHFATCFSCAFDIFAGTRKCPICREQLDGIVRTFIS